MFNFLPRNSMLFDLGFDNLEAANNETAVDDMIRQVDTNFDIVLMMERYNFFLILCSKKKHNSPQPPPQQ